jgi:hypothetical protein
VFPTFPPFRHEIAKSAVMKTSWTTREAARAAKISRATLQSWIASKKIVAPSVRLIKGKAVRVWNASDIKKLRAAKSAIYGQGKGKKRESRRAR